MIRFLFVLLLPVPTLWAAETSCFNLEPSSASDGVLHSYMTRTQPEEWLKIGRAPTLSEFEVTKDIMHGLSMRVVFAKGKSLFVDSRHSESFKNFFKRLKQDTIASVSYSPESLKRLGNILKRVCESLGRSGCGVYDRYQGPEADEKRPLNGTEERAAKWAAFYELPSFDIPFVVKLKGVQNALIAVDFMRHGIEPSILDLLSSGFEPQDVVTVYSKAILPVVDATYESAKAQIRGGGRPS